MFPNYKTLHKKFLLLFPYTEEIPDNWKPLGLMPTWTEIVGGETWERWEIHPFCKRRIHLGKENGETFKYCPLCMTKITYLTDK